MAIARNELVKHGWKDLSVDKVGVIDPSSHKDDETINNAIRDGFSATIYGGVEP